MTEKTKEGATFRRLIEHANQAIFVAQDAKLVYLNPVTSRVMGHSREELMARSFLEFIHPDDRDMILERYLRRLQGEEFSQEHPFRVIHKDGRILWVELYGFQTEWEGRPATLNFLRDISEQKQAEEGLRASREELRLTLEATTDGIWQWNFNTNELHFSPRYYTMLGYEPNAFPATFEALKGITHPDDLQKALAVAREHRRTRQDYYENVFRLRTASGDYRWIESRGRVVERDPEGNAVRMIGRHEDITKLKEAEAELHERERRYKSLFDSIRDPILVADEERTVLDCNPAFSELFGYAPNEIKGQKTSLAYERKDQYEEMGRALRDALGSKEIVSTIDFRKKSGMRFPERSNSRI